MESMYANSFSITTTESNEVFLTFQMLVPKYDEDGKQTGMEQKASATVVMGNGSYKAFKEMLDNLGVKE